MEKIFLIDAYALIYRSYYAMIRTPRVNSKGVNTSAVMGFCNTLLEVLQKESPGYMGVAFDRGRTFRHEAYPAYKAQREETPEDIRSSVPVIKEILRAWRIPVLEAEGFEADDVIGTLAVKAAENGLQAYMLTPDKDYAQIVRPGVAMYRPRHGGGYEVMGEKEVAEKFGVETPGQVVDLLALMGDSSDNYPGCPGVGEKTAAKLISQFGSIDGILAHTSEIKGKLREKVEAATEDIRMSRYLATIRTDVPIDLDLEELQTKEPDEEKLRGIFEELEFRNFANRIFNKGIKTENRQENQLSIFAEFAPDGPGESVEDDFESVETTPHSYKLVDKKEDMEKLCDYLITKPILSLDTETDSTNAIVANLVGLSFSVAPGEAFYVPVPENRDEALAVVAMFKPAYENTESEKCGQNIKYDMEVLSRYGVEVAGPLFDTMVAHYLLQPEVRHNMDYMAETLLHYRTIHIDSLIGPKGKAQKSMRDIPPAEVCDYACEDADITLRLRNTLAPKIAESGAGGLFANIEMPLIPVLADMERAGVRLNTAELAKTSETLTARLAECEGEAYGMAGQQFNTASPKQVGEVLFEKLKITDKPKKTKTGQYVTGEEVLQQLRGKHPIVGKILDIRGLKKLLGTYVDALPLLVNPATGRIHTSFNQAVTATGRLSSSDPNLQNIPVRGEDGREIRRCFVPEEGCLFLSADYSQIELRVMAHLSGDENMAEAFLSGQDIHAATAAKIYHKPIGEVTKDERTKAKRANFGIIYGISAFGLATQLGIPRAEAKELIDGYFATFPKVAGYMEKAVLAAREKGYAETIFHRRRYLPDITSRNATVRSFAERNAVNAPIQGSAADIIKAAMVAIHRRFAEEGVKARMILQVHDELNFSVPPGEKDTVEEIVIGEMQRAYPLSVPLVADFGWGANWLEAH